MTSLKAILFLVQGCFKFELPDNAMICFDRLLLYCSSIWSLYLKIIRDGLTVAFPMFNVVNCLFVGGLVSCVEGVGVCLLALELLSHLLSQNSSVSMP